MPGVTLVDQLLASAIQRIEFQIKHCLISDDRQVRPWLNYAAASRGKRLRARLTLLSGQAVGQVSRRVERLAAAMELLHQATLAHDDIIDHAAERRHRQTLNARFGNEVAVLIGDLMFVQALNLLVPDMPGTLTSIVARAATRVCLGEIQEIKFFRKTNLTRELYLKMIAHKTASLLSACCEGGAVAAQAAPRAAKALAVYGQNLGMAFQIRDDLLDILGTRGRVGKPVGSDVKEGRITLPVILGLKAVKGPDREILFAAVQNAKSNHDRIRMILEKNRILDQTQRLAARYARKAQKALETLKPSAAKKALMELADFAAKRDH